MSLISRLRRKAAITLRRALGLRDSATRIARGAAGGFFAAAFPLPGFQIPLSILCAWLLRGNKAVAILPQFISNAGTMLPLAVLQFKIGSLLWPLRAGVSDAVYAAKLAWDWSDPAGSAGAMFRGITALGIDVAGPLLVGVLLTGLVMAIISYPLTLAGVWYWRAKRHRRRAGRPAARRPLALRGTSGPPMPAQDILRRYVRRPRRFHNAEQVKLLVDGREAFPEMLAAINAARHEVLLETYILRDDHTGQAFSEALCAAADRGVDVRLTYDWVGSLGIRDAFIRKLALHGVDVRVYHPLVWTRPSWAVNRRNHRKVLVVDRHMSFTGGMNICDDGMDKASGGAGWRDTHVRLDGHTVAGLLVELFETAWGGSIPYARVISRRRRLRAGVARQLRKMIPRRRRLVHLPRLGDPCGVAVDILGNEEFRYRRRIHRAHLHAIRSARDYILIENAYFIPDRDVRRALAAAVKRGVAVAVVVSRHSDVATAAYATRSLYGELLASGVRIFEWPEPMLHAKTAVIDDAWSIVGSYNFDRRSLLHQLEAVAMIADASFARQLRQQTLQDIAQCEEITLARHESRPLRVMLLEAMAFMLKYWL